MMQTLSGSILDRLPEPIPRRSIRVDESFDVERSGDSDDDFVYNVEKAPYIRLVTVSAVVDGIQRELVIGDEVVPRDTNDDGEPDSVAFVGDERPDDGTVCTVTYDCTPVIARYVGAFDDDIELVDEQLDDVADSKFVERATDHSLDHLGSRYGVLGDRRGRDDDEYRSFLQNITGSLDGTGTLNDIEFIASEVLQVDDDQVEIEEHFDTNSFRVRISDLDHPISPATFHDLVDLARPSGVVLEAPLTVLGEDTTVGARTDEADVVDQRFGLSSSTIGEGGSLLTDLSEW